MSPRLKGSIELEKRLAAIPQEVLENLRPALVKSVEEVAANMHALVPIDEGDLDASIAVTGPNQTTPAYAVGGGSVTAAPNQAFVTVGNPEVRTGHIVEFGSVKMEARPFMIPAFRIAKPRIMRRLSRAVGAAIKKAGAK